MSKDSTPPIGWSVREEGNKVIMEIDCRDNYEAIALTEVIAAGMREGYLELEFDARDQPNPNPR